MLRNLREFLRVLPGILGALFIGTIVTLFLVFPRVINELANLLGDMGDPLQLTPVLLHWAIALVIDFTLLYFFVYRPLRRYRKQGNAHGLLVERGQGIAHIDTESVRQQIYAAVTKVSDVQRVEITVTSDLGRAVINMNVRAANKINGPKKKNEIRREVKKVVEDQFGVRLAGEPEINISLESIGQEVPQAIAPAEKPSARPAPIPAAPVVSRPPESRPISAPTPGRVASLPDKPELEAPAASSSPIFTRRTFATPTPKPAEPTSDIPAMAEPPKPPSEPVSLDTLLKPTDAKTEPEGIRPESGDKKE